MVQFMKNVQSIVDIIEVSPFSFHANKFCTGIHQLESANRYKIIFNVGLPVKFQCGDQTKTCDTFSILSILAPGAKQELVFPADCSFISIAIDPDFIFNWLGTGKVDFITPNNASSLFLSQSLSAVHVEISKPHIIEKRYLTSLVMVVMNELYCGFRGSGKKIFSPKGKLSAHQMKNVIDLVRSSLHSEIHLSMMANEVHLSEFHFSRLFRNTFGISPYQYVLQIKVEYAKTLLRNYPRSLSQIAHSLNFTDQSHFTNVFKKITGTCPSDFAMNRVPSAA